MTKKECFNLFYKIFLQHCDQIWIHAGKEGDGFYSYPFSKEVVGEPNSFVDPDEWDIFALLHEIGHVKTNTTKMKRCEQEYYATQWAIKEAKRIRFSVPKQYIGVYQNYIWDWREKAIKRRAKIVPSKKELTLCA